MTVRIAAEHAQRFFTELQHRYLHINRSMLSILAEVDGSYVCMFPAELLGAVCAMSRDIPVLKIVMHC